MIKNDTKNDEDRDFQDRHKTRLAMLSIARLYGEG